MSSKPPSAPERPAMMTPAHTDYEFPYMEVATFMRAPLSREFSDAEIGLVGIPYDGGVTNRAGARHGPREIRNMSSFMRRANQTSGIAPLDLCRVYDLGDAPTNPFSVEKTVELVSGFYRKLHEAGVIPISAGGDHSVSFPVMKGIGFDRPLGMVHFDAHCDTCDDFMDEKFHHGAPFRRAVETGVLDPKRCVQIGIRGSLPTTDFWQFSYDTGMRVITMDEFYEMGVDAVIQEARRVVGDGATYITFDVDGIDPTFTPGTGTPEIGGFSTYEAQRMVRGLRGLNLVGGDVVEVAPPADPTGNTALVGATIMFEILCVMADAVASRRNDREAAE
jgi:guanidinopropionase